VILAIQSKVSLWMVQEGRIGPKETYSLICSLGEFERSNGDGNGSIG
jgi:hypothetical protein